jgi:hypothetical protein
MISFEETSNLGRGRYIKVKLTKKVGPGHSQYKRLKGKPVTITIGRIEFSRDGKFRYFEPETNELNPTLIEDDLDKLKERIKAHRKGQNS